MDSYGKRLIRAREFAKISQSELARRVTPPLKPQAIQYLEGARNKATGSRNTSAFAKILGVDAHWLATGEGSMTAPTTRAEQPGAEYALSEDAQQIAIAWSKLDPVRQSFFRELIFLQAASIRKAPWLYRGRPKSETYEDWERRQLTNFQAMAVLNPQGKKK